jgi:curli biogenesis system outer membrane secretion channel CsgG
MLSGRTVHGRYISGWVFVVLLVALGLTGCAGAPPSGEPVAVAVWDLENLGAAANADNAMGALLASQIAAHLETVPGFRVVERQELLKALEELNIGSSQLADAETRLKLGAIIGARQMVFGAFQQYGDAVRLDVRRVDVASGKIIKTSSATADGTGGSALLDAADRAAQGLVAQ